MDVARRRNGDDQFIGGIGISSINHGPLEGDIGNTYPYTKMELETPMSLCLRPPGALLGRAL